MRPFPQIKFFGAWVCIIAAVVLLVLGRGAASVPVEVLVGLAIAFSLAPASW